MEDSGKANAFASPQYKAALFDQSPVGIGFVSADGRWFKVNEKLQELFGFTPSEFAELSWEHVTRYQDIAPDRDQVRRCLEGEIDGYTLEKVYRRKDGSEFWAWLTVKVVRDTGGTFTHFVTYVIPVRRKLSDSRPLIVVIKFWRQIGGLIIFLVGSIAWAFGHVKASDLINLIKTLLLNP